MSPAMPGMIARSRPGLTRRCSPGNPRDFLPAGKSGNRQGCLSGRFPRGMTPLPVRARLSSVPTTGTINPTLSQLTLVTPTFVNALGNNLPVFASLTIRFSDAGGLPPFLVPEPSTLLLFGAGTLGLWLAGRRRQ